MHALTEAHRVLKADGLLIDLRPAAVHRRVHLVRGKEARLLGVLRERFDDERASDRAVAAVVQSGLFQASERTAFPCNRVTSTFEEFRAWLEGFALLQKELPSHDWLLRRVARAVVGCGGPHRIVVAAPVDLRVLRPLSTRRG